MCGDSKKALTGSTQAKLKSELLDWAAAHPLTGAIKTLLFHPGFPVDFRHNAKIIREELAVWAKNKLDMKLFVTGGGGFLGLAIVRQLCAQGHEVVTFSRGNYPALEQLAVKHFRGDLSEYALLKQAMMGCEAVFHVAAKTGIWGKYEDFYKANVIGTENVLRACRELGIRNLIFTSSPSVVYDGKDSEGQNESLPYPKKYDAYYPQTKAIAERLVMAANNASLKTVSLRPHLIWGPEDPHFLPRLFEKARAGKLRIIGTAPNLVDCIYVDNAAKAHLQAFDQAAPAIRQQ